MSDRALQVFLIVSFIAFSWLGFMVVHEFGHIAVAWSSGGSLSHVTLHPLQISWSASRRTHILNWWPGADPSSARCCL